MGNEAVKFLKTSLNGQGISGKEELLEHAFKNKIIKVQQFEVSRGFFHITGKCDEVSYGVTSKDLNHVIFIIQPDHRLIVPVEELDESVTILN